MGGVSTKRMDTDANKLVNRVITEFGSIVFPSHCGLRAAVAMDDWISDPIELRRITAEQDVKGEWWEIPESELKEISLASCYLDATGTQFYLPALLVKVLRDLSCAYCAALVRWLTPLADEPDCALYQHFLAKFAALTEGQKDVCTDVLRYVGARTNANDPWITDKIGEILTHEYWQEGANKAFQRTLEDSRR
jgi:hypothetical protein